MRGRVKTADCSFGRPRGEQSPRSKVGMHQCIEDRRLVPDDHDHEQQAVSAVLQRRDLQYQRVPSDAATP